MDVSDGTSVISDSESTELKSLSEFVVDEKSATELCDSADGVLKLDGSLASDLWED